MLLPCGTLHTTRLHVKRGTLPRSVVRFIPKIKESYILERTVISAARQTMHTDIRNLDWEGVLSVVESQLYVPTPDGQGTHVDTIVRFESRVGEGENRRWWGRGGVQRSIEMVGRGRIRDGLVKSQKGIEHVLQGFGERVVEERRAAAAVEERQSGLEKWRRVWRGVEEV